MRQHFYAFVGELTGPPRVRHSVGLPSELTGADDDRQLLPPPRLLLIEDTDAGVFLYRYAADGSFGGDTWHQTVDDAKEQAEFEYGGAVEHWLPVPIDVVDLHAFAVSQSELAG